MNTKIKADWQYGTWDGCRILMLKQSLKLTPKERFEALEETAKTSDWLNKKSILKKKEIESK